MRLIVGYRKLLNVTESATLSELKSAYRNLMKDWHPDKFAEDAVLLKEAEEKSKKIIQAYHFLVSISAETITKTIDAYTDTINNAAIVDFEYKSEVLRVVFADDTEYEYYGVPKATYVKLVNAETPQRFARRHIFQSFVYRSTSKLVSSPA
ncbi:MAG: KTSC domain-containing protein [Sphingobacteriia bacterium]|jgi:curved DNA-binding protein CbpA